MHFRDIAILLLLVLVAAILPALCHGQSFGSSTGLLQGEHLARVNTLYNDTLRASSDTTAWLPIGTFDPALAAERPYAPGRFTAFVWLDTTGTNAAAGPSVVMRAELALADTSRPYDHADGTLSLVPSSSPLTGQATGHVLPVPAYGGGYLRFILTAEDSTRVELDLWRTH